MSVPMYSPCSLGRVVGFCAPREICLVRDQCLVGPMQDDQQGSCEGTHRQRQPSSNFRCSTAVQRSGRQGNANCYMVRVVRLRSRELAGRTARVQFEPSGEWRRQVMRAVDSNLPHTRQI